MDHFFFFSIHLEHGRPWIGLHVLAPKKLTLYYYYDYYYLNSTSTHIDQQQNKLANSNCDMMPDY